MRSMKVVLLITLVALSASVAHAANMTFGLNGGISSPTGDYSDGYKLGFNGGVYGDWWLKDSFGFGVDINGDFLKGKDDFINSLKSPSYPNPDAKSTIISFGAHGLFAMPMTGSPIQPWITYGAGLYRVNSKITDAGPTIDVDKSDNKFGLQGGVGADYKAGGAAKIGVDVRYHYILDAFEVANGSGGTDKKAANYVTAGVHVTFTTTGLK